MSHSDLSPQYLLPVTVYMYPAYKYIYHEHYYFGYSVVNIVFFIYNCRTFLTHLMECYVCKQKAIGMRNICLGHVTHKTESEKLMETDMTRTRIH